MRICSRQGKIDAPGWVPAKISFALCLDETGELTQVMPTMEDVTKGKKTVRQPQTMALPAAVKRTVGIASNFLVGQFLLSARYRPKGQAGAQPRLLSPRRRSCTTRCWTVLIPPPPGQFWHFSTHWKPENAAEHPALAGQLDEVTAGGNLMFRAGRDLPAGGRRHPRGVAAVSGERRCGRGANAVPCNRCGKMRSPPYIRR